MPGALVVRGEAEKVQSPWRESLLVPHQLRRGHIFTRNM